MDPHTFSEGQKVKHIILGLIWQILAVSLHTNFIIFTLFDEKDQRKSYEILTFFSIAYLNFSEIFDVWYSSAIRSWTNFAVERWRD